MFRRLLTLNSSLRSFARLFPKDKEGPFVGVSPKFTNNFSFKITVSLVRFSLSGLH